MDREPPDGWSSYNGFENAGRVTFETIGPMQTLVDVFISYNQPAGVLGDAGEKLGAGSRFENALQHDLDNFARMVDTNTVGTSQDRPVLVLLAIIGMSWVVEMLQQHVQ